MDQPGYELLDAGDGRRLERFGDRVVDRPAPFAVDRRRDPGDWDAADLAFDPGTGWRAKDRSPLDPWRVGIGPATLELRPTDSGQVGLFPEHRDAIDALVERLGHSVSEGVGASALNLFAYTGFATLTLAAEGVAVAHVDAQRTAVTWARRNAHLSGLDGDPIRWLVEDVLAFTEREARRGRRYDAIVLDPPTFGHAGRRRWEIERDLPRLLTACARVAADDALVLLTAHAEGLAGEDLADLLADAFPARRPPEIAQLRVVARSGAILRLGWAARIG